MSNVDGLLCLTGGLLCLTSTFLFLKKEVNIRTEIAFELNDLLGDTQKI